MGELKCHIVRDLLPLYNDDLLSEESRAEVEQHLKTCENCANIYRQMNSKLEPLQTETAREDIDYLKKVKRKNHKNIILAAVAAVVAVVGIWAAQTFYIGRAAVPGDISWQCFQDDGRIYLDMMAKDSASGFRHWNIAPTNAEDEGYIDITAKKVLISPLSTGGHEFSFEIGEVKQISLFGEVVWQDGVGIIPKVSALYKAHTPYVGDLSAIGRVAQALNIAEVCGNYKNELHTSSEPYSWSFDFTEILSEQWQEDELNYQMEKNAYFLVALIDNLRVVEWTYTDYQGNFVEKSISIEELEAKLPQLFSEYNEKYQTDFTAKSSLKSYADSQKDLQILYNVVR